jgi:hypothetical protein
MAYSFEPSITNAVFVPDQLIAGSHDIVTDTVSIASGQVLLRGAVVGQQTANEFAVVSSAATVAGGANTGTGTIASITTGPQQKIGTYRVTLTAATTFNVYDPTGELVGSGSTGTAFTSVQVAFTVTAGGTAFAANDGFNLAVEAVAGTGAGAYVLVTGTAVDGSQNPGNWLILAEDTNTSASGTNAVTSAPVYLAGEFDGNYLTFGAGLTIQGIRAALRAIGSEIFIKGNALTNAIL